MTIQTISENLQTTVHGIRYTLSRKFGHKVAPQALSHCLLGISLMAISVSIEFVSSSARVISVKSAKGLGLTQ